MPQMFESSITNSDEIHEDECKHLPLNCVWTITSKDASLTAIIICLKWTSNHDLCLRVTAYPLEMPNVSKHIDQDDHHPLLRSLIHAHKIYEVFSQPHLSPYRFECLEELKEYLDLKFN